MPDVQPVDFPGRVFIGEAVWARIRREAACFRFRETGGVLFGYRNDKDIVITEATGPGPQARHRRTWFEPDTTYCQAQLAAIYERTGGAISYLGEWHTHPCGNTQPSFQDLKSMLTLAKDPGTRQPEPLLLIFRPENTVLIWGWTEDWSISVLDIRSKSWQKVDASSIVAVADSQLRLHLEDLR